MSFGITSIYLLLVRFSVGAERRAGVAPDPTRSTGINTDADSTRREICSSRRSLDRLLRPQTSITEWLAVSKLTNPKGDGAYAEHLCTIFSPCPTFIYTWVARYCTDLQPDTKTSIGCGVVDTSCAASAGCNDSSFTGQRESIYGIGRTVQTCKPRLDVPVPRSICLYSSVLNVETISFS